MLRRVDMKRAPSFNVKYWITEDQSKKDAEELEDISES